MIVGREHGYVFVQLPHTGCTAVAEELTQMYGGVHMLSKHSRYSEFQRGATAEERRFPVFSAVRNPLDEAVSIFYRYFTNHQGDFTNPKMLAEQGGYVNAMHLERFEWVRKAGEDFPGFVRRFYRTTYDNWSLDAHHRFAYVMRFENLADDFSAALRRMGIPPVRPLPVVNRTNSRRKAFWEYYPETLRAEAVRIFGPFMAHWGYAFPSEWGDVTVPARLRMVFEARSTYRRWRGLYRRKMSRAIAGASEA